MASVSCDSEMSAFDGHLEMASLNQNGGVFWCLLRHDFVKTSLCVDLVLSFLREVAFDMTAVFGEVL